MELKNIYRGNEIKFANLFRAIAPTLLTEFLQEHPDVMKNSGLRNVPQHQSPAGENSNLYSKQEAWRTAGVKHAIKGMIEQNRSKYPTAFELTEAFGNECLLSGYSVLDAGSVIYRHTDLEHRDAKCIRIHIPLYIPTGDIGAEVNGEVIEWNDIWAFNNQKLHGVWNNTPERRIVFLIDITRKYCDLPSAPAWFPGCNEHVPEFEKTRDPSRTSNLVSPTGIEPVSNS